MGLTTSVNPADVVRSRPAPTGALGSMRRAEILKQAVAAGLEVNHAASWADLIRQVQGLIDKGSAGFDPDGKLYAVRRPTMLAVDEPAGDEPVGPPVQLPPEFVPDDPAPKPKKKGKN